MTREEAKAFLPVLAAFAAGKPIQVLGTFNKVWHDTELINNFERPWRIKPKPRELWVCFNCHTISMTMHNDCPHCHSQDDAHPMTHMRETEGTL